LKREGEPLPRRIILLSCIMQRKAVSKSYIIKRKAAHHKEKHVPGESKMKLIHD